MPKKRKDGLLQKKFTVNGKRYYVYGRTGKELFEKETRKREEIERGFQLRTNPTVKEYYEKWHDRRRGTIKESTLRTEDKKINCILAINIPGVKRNFGELKVSEVSIEDLYYLQGELKKTRKTQTVNDYLAIIKHLMKDARKERLIEYDPCVLLNNLKRTEEKARDTYHRALSIKEQSSFFECDRAKSSFYYNAFRFAILTGMRAGEIGALKYGDIRDDKIHVERTITRTEAGNYVVGESAKTKCGRRTIPINDSIRKVIDEQKMINIALDGDDVTKDSLIFKAPERGLLMSTPMDREIRRICDIIEIEPFSMHAFRDTFATRAIECGINPRTLQELLGHSNFNLTMSLYGHVLDDTKTKAMDSLKIDI